MSIMDFGDKSKDEIIEYLIDEHNATERETAQLRQELAEAKETIEEFKRMIFASRSEKKHVGYDNPEQLTLMDLFNEAELAADPNAEEPTEETIVKGCIRKQEGEKKKKASYKELYDKLPPRDLLCHLAPDAKICPQCGSTMERVGWEKVRTELEVIPAQIRLVNIYQETVRCQKCYEETGYAGFARAVVPSPLIPHSPASPTTVAYVMYQKYINSMPLYRQEKEWKQMGVSIQHATLANWCIYCGKNYMKPLYDALASTSSNERSPAQMKLRARYSRKMAVKLSRNPTCGSTAQRISMVCRRSCSMSTILHGQERYRRTSTSRSAASTSGQMGIRDTIICRRASSDVAAWHISGVSSMTQYRQRTARVVSPGHLPQRS